MLDPVRFLSNLSTGEMGYSVAREAKRRGYEVTLISGPTSLKPPKGVLLIPVVSAKEMQQACHQFFPKHDILVMSAAVSDFTAEHFVTHKIKRARTKKIHLKKNPDIVAGLCRKRTHQLVIGFCLETENWLIQAERKLRKKGLDGIVANYLSEQHDPFGARRVNVALLDKAGGKVFLKGQSKPQIAEKLLGWIESNF